MSDRDEMREALADAIDWIECIGKELREIADYERSQLCPEAADEYERQAREGADIAAALSRLSASGQGEREGLAELRIGLEHIAVGDMTPAWYERKARALLARIPAALAPEKVNAQMADECAKACDRIDAMDSGQVGACLGVTAPEKGEARS